MNLSSTPNPKHLSVVNIAAGSHNETARVDYPCRLWGILGRVKGTINSAAVVEFRDDTVAGASAIKFSAASGFSIAAGQGYLYRHDVKGMLFIKGITSKAIDANSVGGWDLLVERVG